MRAAMLTEAGVKIQSTPEPAPKPNEVKVRVRACGLNRADLLVASGHAHGRIGGAGTIIGLEFAGDVVEVGADAKGVAVGDRVMCSGGSGWAEYAVADWGRVTRIPDANVSYEQAATLPVALQTMHDAIVTNGQLQAGQAVLIQGASSGVWLMAMKIAKVLGAGLVIGTSTDAGRRAKLTDFGADLAVESPRLSPRPSPRLSPWPSPWPSPATTANPSPVCATPPQAPASERAPSPPGPPSLPGPPLGSAALASNGGGKPRSSAGERAPPPWEKPEEKTRSSPAGSAICGPRVPALRKRAN